MPSPAHARAIAISVRHGWGFGDIAVANAMQPRRRASEMPEETRDTPMAPDLSERQWNRQEVKSLRTTSSGSLSAS
jgi:hypothetical protein